LLYTYFLFPSYEGDEVSGTLLHKQSHRLSQLWRNGQEQYYPACLDSLLQRGFVAISDKIDLADHNHIRECKLLYRLRGKQQGSAQGLVDRAMGSRRRREGLNVCGQPTYFLVSKVSTIDWRLNKMYKVW